MSTLKQCLIIKDMLHAPVSVPGCDVIYLEQRLDLRHKILYKRTHVAKYRPWYGTGLRRPGR